MTTPLLTTKLYNPQPRPGLVPRPRLIRRLEEGCSQGHRLTFISAPAGSGKTTLVTEWLSGVDRPFAWLSLDEGDNDPARFLIYLTAALQKINPEVGRSVQDLLQTPQLVPLESLVTWLLNDLAAMPTSSVMVLDDYHLIQNQEIHQVMEFWLHHQPPQMHLVLVTRRDPPLSFSRLRVGHQMTEIRAEDLSFTAEETGLFLQGMLGRKLDPALVLALEDRTEGWIAGLQLAGLSLQSKAAEQVSGFISAFRGSHRHVIEYLAEEVLAQQPEEIRDFLCQTAILDRLTARLCEAVTGRPDSDSILHRLEQTNLFLIPLDEEQEWFRYHRLFADFLRTELEPQSQASLHLKAARWWEEHEAFPEAIHHVLKAGDMEEAARMIIRAADWAWQSGSLTTLRGWLKALPEEIIQANGELALLQGFILSSTDHFTEAEAYASLADGHFPSEVPSLGRGRLLTLKALLGLRQGEIEPALRLATEALGLLGDNETYCLGLAWMALGQAQDQLGDIVAAVQSYRTSALLDQQRNHHWGSLMALTHLAIKLNSWGRRSEALALCQKTWEEDQFPERRLRGQPWADVIYLAWGLVTYEADELDQAREYVAKALALFQQLGMENIYLATKINLVEIQIAAGKWDAALAMVAQGRQAAMQLQLEDLQALIAAWEAQIRLQQGDIEAASRWAETRNFSTFSRPATWHEQQIDWIYTRLLLAQNRPEEAQTLLVHLEQAARERGRQRSLITIHLLQARTEHALGHEARVSTYLEQALQLAAPEGYLRAFLNEGPLVGGLLPRVRHIAPHFVDSLLRRAGIEAAPFLEQPLPDPLTEREREILHLMAKGWKYQEMADQLFVSINTVRFHAKNLFSKLEVHNRAQAVARARDLNLL